jgi:hypothetical protein
MICLVHVVCFFCFNLFLLVSLAACLRSSAALYVWNACSFRLVRLVRLALSVKCFSCLYCRFYVRLFILLLACVRLLLCVFGLPVLFILPYLLNAFLVCAAVSVFAC